MTASLLPTYNRAPLTFVSGAGSWLTEADGRRFLDMGAGIAVNVLGHAAPELADVLAEQGRKLWHVSNLYRIPEQEALGDALVAATFADRVFFTNSGTEAAELAIKMVRKYWHDRGEDRPTILTFEGAFHGRSTGAIAAAGSDKMTKGFGPLMPGFKVLPWGDHDALRAAMDDTVAAVMLEPIQGEGGIRPLPDACLKGLRDLCDATGALMVLDEVQCGMGRTGRLFAHEWAGVTPDIMMVAKGIGGGFPLGAILAKEAVAKHLKPGTHGTTYGGGPLACAAGNAVLDVMLAPGFMEGVRRKGILLKQKLAELRDRYPGVISEVRGEGLLIGLRVGPPAGDLVDALRAEHVIAVGAGDNVVRLLPPLVISEDELAEVAVRIGRAAARLEAGSSGTAPTPQGAAR
jgi:acetylornithine/N-succinyldiaminopimelate aminotransferase